MVDRERYDGIEKEEDEGSKSFIYVIGLWFDCLMALKFQTIKIISAIIQSSKQNNLK